MPFKKILLPIDINDSNSWKNPIPLCISMLRDHPDAKLHLLSVVPNFGLKVVEEFFPKGWTKEFSQKTLETLEKIAKDNIPEDLSPKISVNRGVIYEVLLDYATKHEIDLIVMSASHPHRKDYLLGPNVARVARHAEMSVLIVR